MWQSSDYACSLGSPRRVYKLWPPRRKLINVDYHIRSVGNSTTKNAETLKQLQIKGLENINRTEKRKMKGTRMQRMMDKELSSIDSVHFTFKITGNCPWNHIQERHHGNTGWWPVKVCDCCWVCECVMWKLNWNSNCKILTVSMMISTAKTWTFFQSWTWLNREQCCEQSPSETCNHSVEPGQFDGSFIADEWMTKTILFDKHLVESSKLRLENVWSFSWILKFSLQFTTTESSNWFGLKASQKPQFRNQFSLTSKVSIQRHFKFFLFCCLIVVWHRVREALPFLLDNHSKGSGGLLAVAATELFQKISLHCVPKCFHDGSLIVVVLACWTSLLLQFSVPWRTFH